VKGFEHYDWKIDSLQNIANEAKKINIKSAHRSGADAKQFISNMVSIEHCSFNVGLFL
jgi:predicted AAA+ superfamily ATPase